MESKPSAGVWRPSWGLLCVLAALPMLLLSRGAPLGEPFADDFYFLRRVVIAGPRPLWDGGGSPVFWRPLARQLYYGVFGETMLVHPRAVVLLHTALLVLAALLIYRALRPRWSGLAAAVAASAPLLVESTRMLIGWPSHFQDVGALFFAALALHEASRRRLLTTLVALLASFLCKELTAAVAFLIPWMPGVGPIGTRARLRWSAAIAGLITAWGSIYFAIARGGGIGFEHEATSDSVMAHTPLVVRVLWAIWHSARGALSLPAGDGRWDLLAGATIGALVLAAVAIGLAHAQARQRLRAALPWAAWGLAWFVLSSASLAEVFPSWSAQRCVFASVGLGIAFTALLAAVHRALLVPLVVLQVFLFSMSPATPSRVSPEPVAADEFDFRHFVRLERMTQETRRLLHDRFPTLPPGTMVGQHNLPLMSEHAFAGSNALQVWYRDSTLRWVRFDRFDPARDTTVVAFVEYQPEASRQFALVEPAAMRGLIAGADRIRDSQWEAAVIALDGADAAQGDSGALVFLGTTASKRALCLTELGREADAVREARRALVLWPQNPDSRFTLASVELAHHRYAAAETLLIAQLTLYPTDGSAAELLERVRREALPRGPH